MQTNLCGAQARANGQGFLELCERVASQSELTEELASLTELMKLPLSCCLAVHQVLREGNWANAQYPKAYIKRAAMTQARKDECGEKQLVFMDGAEIDARWDGNELAPGKVDKSSLWDEPRPSSPIPLKGKHYARAQFARDDEVLAREVEAAESGPAWPSDCLTPKVLYAKNPDGSVERIVWTRLDWRKLGEKAGLDEWQIKVLVYRSGGVSRDQAMNAQPDEVSRKAIQAAWRYMDRTGIQRVQNYLRKSSEEMSRKRESETQGNERTFSPPNSKAAVSGNPLKAAWKHSDGTCREDLGRFLIKYRGRAPHLFGNLVKILDSQCPE